ELLQQAMALRVGTGDTFDYPVPSWVIEKHAPPDDPDLPRYGLSQAFLAVCDGEIGISPDWKTVDNPLAILTDATRGFPLTCYERNTNQTKERGPDHFMVSYSNLYVYDELTNQNPIIEGFRFDTTDVTGAALCIGQACQNADDPPCGSGGMPSVKACDPDHERGCGEHRITPVLKESENNERDAIASTVGGGDENLREQMWIRYYSDLGKVKRDTKRLQDATDGWYSDHYTEWTPPTQGSGVAHIWSVVYDNRGGVEWARVSVCVTE
ncbi:MAG TPA: hypothetical protein VKP30_17475, partial [Polyangiaceae bacterium]|nr:hypothetical protein [Polyangiaceae bacterium]